MEEFILNGKSKIGVYIVHEYYDKSHFRSLYEKLDEYSYYVEDYIILSKVSIISLFLKNILKNNFIDSLKTMTKNIIKLIKFNSLKNKILIVGIAPYNNLMNRYERVFRNNKSIYFTSWQCWDGSYFPRGKLKNKNIFEKILMEDFSAVACVSEYTRNCINAKFKIAEVVNHSINISEYKTRELVDKNFIKKFIYLGRLETVKNMDLIINWINNNKEENFEFYFAGVGRLKKQIIDLSNRDYRVKYLGRLTKQEIKEKLNNYNFLVLPSKEELFGIVLIEALAAGVPCITSDTLGPNEVITDKYNGLVFNKYSYDDFDKKMSLALKMHFKEYKILHNNAILSSKKYDTTNIVLKWIELFESVK